MEKKVITHSLVAWLLCCCFFTPMLVQGQLNKTATQNNFYYDTIYQARSPIGEHITLQLKNKGIPIWGKKKKLFYGKQGQLISTFDQSNIEGLHFLPYTPTLSNIESNNAVATYFVKNEVAIPAYKHSVVSAGVDSIFIVDEQGIVLLAQSNLLYAKIDTTIATKVYNPDPLTSSKKIYGNTCVDNNDSNAAWLSAALVSKNVNARYDSALQKFLLENNVAVIEDLLPPHTSLTTSNTASFFYQRNDTAFEDVNAFYHVTTFHDYLIGIGYGSLLNLKLKIDAHSLSGADNSVFSANGGVPTLNLGTGGVDDGEDADVIIHEYSHGLSWSANDNFLASGSERSALDEGLADYFATSYSRAIDTFGWQRMFSWDGHNEYWKGRVANTTRNYSSPFLMGIYEGGEIWNSAMQKIWTSLGRQKTDKLMLAAMYNFTDNTTFPEAAAMILQADSVMNSGANTQIICTAFRERNIEPAWGCATQNNYNEVVLGNSLAFAQGLGNATLYLPRSSNHAVVSIFNTLGQLMLNKKIQAYTLSLDHQSFAPGMYVIVVQHEGKIMKGKMVKW